MTVTVGADPEFWLYDNSPGVGAIIPCVGRVPGTKKHPHQLGSGYFCHEDNVTIELGIPVLTDGSTLGMIIKEGKKRILDEFFAPRSGNPYQLYFSDQVYFDSNQLTSKQAQTFGCEPDFDAYTNGKMREVPESIIKGNVRYAGGHIHIGGTFNCPPFVAALFADLFISVNSQISNPRETFSEAATGSALRRDHYGAAGVFREKPYGIEYRTPSNWWCYNAKHGNQIGYNAYQLGRFLEETSATTLRGMIKQIDWNTVREIVAPPKRIGRPQIQEAARELMDEVRKVGVPV